MDQLWLKVQKAPVGAGPCQAQEPVVTGEGFPLQFPVVHGAPCLRMWLLCGAEAGGQELVCPAQGPPEGADLGSAGGAQLPETPAARWLSPQPLGTHEGRSISGHS